MEHYWTESERELAGIRFLDWIAEKSIGGRIPPVEQYVEDSGMDRDTALAFVSDFERSGYVTVARSLATTSTHLTAAGRRFVQTREERRRNPKLRGIACKEALLDWVYAGAESASPTNGGIITDFEGDVRAHFEGDAFSADEIKAAGAHLFAQDLISGVETYETGMIMRPSITATGSTVVEHFDGSLSQYERRGQMTATNYTNSFLNSTNYGPVAAGVSVTQTQSIAPRIPLKDLARHIAAVRAESGGLEEESRISRLLGTIEDTATDDEPDADLLRSVGNSLAVVSGKAGNQALNTAVGALVNFLIQFLPGGQAA